MARGPTLLQLVDARLTLGGAPLFDGASLTLHKGERACLVGPNGAGKSTLMRLLAGLAEPDSGARAVAAGARLAFVPQEPDLGGFATLRDYAMAALGEAEETPAHAAEAALEALGLDPARAPQGLSGGEARRAALARAFAAAPDVLLMDEPTNHLDVPAIEALEARLTQFRGACLVISHDRRFLERVSTACFWLRNGAVLKSERGFSAFDDWAEAVETEEARARARLETQLKAEERWLQRGVTARRSRNEGRRRKLMEMRESRREQTRLATRASAAIQMESAGESGRLAIEAKGLAKAWHGADGPLPVVRDLSLRVMRGDRIGIIGPNGAGKTTLLELLLKRLEPDAGAVRHGSGLEIAYVDQARAALRPDLTVQAALTPLGGDQVVVQGRPRHVAAYARDFLFGPEHLRQPVAALSGGERNRLALAMTLAKPANLLVLDEPTNDLDMDTLDVLEEAVAAFDGTVLIVSHDRAFLDGVTTQVLGAIGGGRWAETPGGYADFIRERPNAFAPAPAAVSPARAGAAPDKAPAPALKAARKLSYKDERRLGELEARLPALEAEIAALEAALAVDGAFARPDFAAKAARLEAAKAEKDSGETEWLELEDKRAALQE